MSYSSSYLTSHPQNPQTNVFTFFSQGIALKLLMEAGVMRGAPLADGPVYNGRIRIGISNSKEVMVAVSVRRGAWSSKCNDTREERYRCIIFKANSSDSLFARNKPAGFL
jgi:hypothetical protein